MYCIYHVCMNAANVFNCTYIGMHAFVKALKRAQICVHGCTYCTFIYMGIECISERSKIIQMYLF